MSGITEFLGCIGVFLATFIVFVGISEWLLNRGQRPKTRQDAAKALASGIREALCPQGGK